MVFNSQFSILNSQFLLAATTALLAAGVAARGAAGVAGVASVAGVAAGNFLDNGTRHHAAADDGLLAGHALGYHARALVGHALGNHDRAGLRGLLRPALVAAHLGGD